MKELPLIDPDIRKARGLPGHFYGHPSWHERVLERVFRPSWQLLAPEVVPTHGASPTEILGEPLLVTADGALSNVCTHRGALLTSEPCDFLRCPYHGRRFDLQGRMLGAPGFEDIQDSDHLPSLRVEGAGPLSFVALEEPAMALPDLLDDLPSRLPEGLPFTSKAHHFDIDCSWALYVENYLEGLHIPFVHRGLNAALDWSLYRNEVRGWQTLQTGLDRQGDEVAWYYWLWPNTMVNVYPWGLSLNRVDPTGPSSCRVHYWTRIWRPELRGQGAGVDLDVVELEDQAVVLSVQRGVRSRAYTRGRFSPTHEAGVHAFQRRLVQRLSE